MNSSDQESKALSEQFEKREAGVTDLFEFYTRVEAVYVAASKALEEGHTAMTSNSANPE